MFSTLAYVTKQTHDIRFECMLWFCSVTQASSTYVAWGRKRGNADFECFPNASSFAYPDNTCGIRRICVRLGSKKCVVSSRLLIKVTL